MNLAGIRDQLNLLQGDLLDQMTLLDAINQAEPDELYNLAATSFVPASWRQPVMTAQFTAVGVTSMLEAIRIVDPSIRVYQASSSEIFGATTESPQSETTPLRAHNPYGVAKLYGHLMVASYRERYGMHACSGILYNHESPRRPRVRGPQGHAGRGGDQARAAGRAAARQPRRHPGLDLHR